MLIKIMYTKRSQKTIFMFSFRDSLLYFKILVLNMWEISAYGKIGVVGDSQIIPEKVGGFRSSSISPSLLIP